MKFFIIQQTKRLLHVFSSSPSLWFRSGPRPLFQQSSLLLRGLSNTRTREASFLLFCIRTQPPVALRSLLFPSSDTGHRRLQALVNLRPGACRGLLSEQLCVRTEARRSIQTRESPHAGRCETAWIPQTSTGKKKTKKKGALPTSCILLFRALMLLHRS